MILNPAVGISRRWVIQPILGAERVVPTLRTLESLLDIPRRLIGSGISREATKKKEVFYEFPMQNPARLRVFA
jgi:hypothetical protein